MENYAPLFGVTQEDIQKIIASALSRGGDYADVFFEYSTSDELTLRDNEVNSVESSIDYGAGVRVLREGRTGYAYSESTAMEDLLRAARTASGIASGAAGETARVEIKPMSFPNRYPVLHSWDEMPLAARRAYLQEVNGRFMAEVPNISKVICNLAIDDSRIMFCNSEGNFFCDRRPCTTLSVSCILVKDGNNDSITTSRSYRMGCEMLDGALISELLQEVLEKSRFIFEATQPKGGDMPVVMGSGSSGILLHEAIGHAFEADFNRKGISIFSDRMGKKICSSKISVVDDATLPANRGSVNVDDEGVVGQKTYMVTGGVLTSYLHDRISAAYYGVAPTGNGRRESFRFNPIPRMRATYMEDGEGTCEDIIRSVKKGIYVDNFTNGQVEIGAGDFTFYVKSGFLIEDGRLTAPIKDVNIIGNGPEALADIVEVAADSRVDNGAWTCGKDQYCAVSCGMPSVLVKSLTVGGSL